MPGLLPFRPPSSVLSLCNSSVSHTRYGITAVLLVPHADFDLQELKFGVEGRQALLNGIDTLARAVATTLGPKGRNVLIESSYGSPKITKGMRLSSKNKLLASN